MPIFLLNVWEWDRIALILLIIFSGRNIVEGAYTQLFWICHKVIDSSLSYNKLVSIGFYMANKRRITYAMLILKLKFSSVSKKPNASFSMCSNLFFSCCRTHSSFCSLHTVSVIPEIFCFDYLNSNIIWLSENFSSLFTKKATLVSSVFLILKTSSHFDIYILSQSIAVSLNRFPPHLSFYSKKFILVLFISLQYTLQSLNQLIEY